MDQRNISIPDLAKAVGMTPRAIHYILDGTNDPYEANLISIAAVLSVKWRTLVEGFDGDPEPVDQGDGITKRKRTVTFIIPDLPELDGEQEGEAARRLLNQIMRELPYADEIILRPIREDKGEKGSKP